LKIRYHNKGNIKSVSETHNPSNGYKTTINKETEDRLDIANNLYILDLSKTG
jgi:hypothetical protein